MPSLSIKDVPEDIVQRLRERAARHHRSLQGELMALISDAVAQDRATPTPAAPGAPAPEPPRAGGKSVEQIALEHRARFPRPLTARPLAVDIVRAERDAR